MRLIVTSNLFETIQNSLKNAISFLLAVQHHDGLWVDFKLPESDEWVTGYVGAILADTGNRSAIDAAWKAWNSFGNRNIFNRHGGWAYNQTAPEDADSTAWGIKFALSLGIQDKGRCKIAEKFLLRHINSDDGLKTYILDDELRKYMGYKPSDDISGWMGTHSCVTAAAAVIPAFNKRLVPYLIRSQLPWGNWGTYWTCDTVYSTAYAVEALLIDGPDKHEDQIAKALSWIYKKFNDRPFFTNKYFPSGSPFATALALKTLILTGSSLAKIEPVFRWLIDQQKNDGSWEPSTAMIIPIISANCCYSHDDSTEILQPEKFLLKLDQNSIFTTATVVDCLSRISKSNGLN